jgi:hypothetical protein
MIVYFVLICLVSLTFQSAIDVTIDNRCVDIELTCPVYFTKDATYHIQLPRQVDSKSSMKVNFKTCINQDTFGGALLYHLQRKKNDESDNRSDTEKDASIGAQLLVIWGCERNKLYSHALLVEHESTITWSKDELKRLYDIYKRHYNTEFISDIDEWWLDDTTKLKTTCEKFYRGFEMNVIMSEEDDLLCPKKPLRIILDR